LQKSRSQVWQEWAENIKQRKLQNLISVLLEAGGPINAIAAQFIHITQPIVGSFVDDSHISALAELLEEKEYTQAFIDHLKEGTI